MNLYKKLLADFLPVCFSLQNDGSDISYRGLIELLEQITGLHVCPSCLFFCKIISSQLIQSNLQWQATPFAQQKWPDMAGCLSSEVFGIWTLLNLVISIHIFINQLIPWIQVSSTSTCTNRSPLYLLFLEEFFWRGGGEGGL